MNASRKKPASLHWVLECLYLVVGKQGQAQGKQGTARARGTRGILHQDGRIVREREAALNKLRTEPRIPPPLTPLEVLKHYWHLILPH